MHQSMHSGKHGIPPKVIQAALRLTTETLAAQLARPGPVEPNWSDFEWRLARATVAIHGVGSLLSTRLRWSGPAGWSQFLVQQREHTVARHQRIEQLLRALDERARDANLPVTALKGAALHSLGLYRCGERPMADLDLLASGQHIEAAGRVLEGMGFRESGRTWKHRVFVTPGRDREALGEHAEGPIKIDLHEHVREILPRRMMDISDCVFGHHAPPGVNYYPSNAALMTHLLLHAAGAMAFRSLRLLNLNDIALLAPRLSSQDWNEVLGAGAGPSQRWWAFPPLELTVRYFNPQIPTDVLTTLRPYVPRLMNRTCRRRVLADWSLSYIWVEAFPGMEWTQSIVDAVAYATSRICPDNETLAMRKARGQARWVAQDPWNRLSQLHRMARWATSGVTRAATMHPVRLALEQER